MFFCRSVAIVFLIALTLPVSVQSVTAELRLIARARRDAGMVANAEDTIRALDTNGNGKVDRSEISAFAQAQGLADDEVLADFKDLDINHDGALDSSEISGLLEDDSSKDAQEHQQRISEKKVEQVKVEETVERPSARRQANRDGQNRQANRDGQNSPSEKSATKAAAVPILQQESVATAEAQDRPSEKFATKVAAEKAPILQQESVAAEEAQKDSEDLSVSSLSSDAQHEADGALAASLARRAQQLLASSAEDENKASAYSLEAKALRGNATALIRKARSETRQAAKEATERVAQDALEQVQKLQEEAAASASGAEMRRKKAKEAMRRVLDAQAALHSASEIS